LAFETALNRAYDAARHQLLSRVAARIAHAAPLLASQGVSMERSVTAAATE
jgi:glycerol-3-phosphate acyltransferase PlsX